MRTSSSRLAHWAGLALCAPILALGALVTFWWLGDEFPQTFEGQDFVLVLMGLAALAALVYGFCRAVAWALSRVTSHGL